MGLRRFHLFEFNDLTQAPESLRESVVETLSRTLRWGRILDGLVNPIEQFLSRAGTREVLDIGSGAGGPATILVDAFRERGQVPPHFRLTDLRPHLEAWAEACATREQDIDFVKTSVDATAIANDLAEGRARTVVNMLHHLPPKLAQSVLLDGVRHGKGIFVAEAFERNPLRFLPIMMTSGRALLLNPIHTQRNRLAKIALTWLTPIAALAGIWDGFVSALRVYTEVELRHMVAPAGDDFEWTYGTFAYRFFGRGYFFYGTRRGKG